MVPRKNCARSACWHINCSHGLLPSACALVRQGRIMLPIHTILHPTDFSECSQCAFGTACALARDYGARLIVLHMIPVGTPEILNLVQLGGESTESIRESVRSSLQRVQAPHPVIQVEHRLEDGDPAKGILRVAEESHAHLIVMG